VTTVVFVVFAAVVATLVGSFLIGSIPFGYLIGRFFYRTDLRASGSGNIGAMNALRTLGKGGAVAVLLLDAAKGFLPVFLVLWLRHVEFQITPHSYVAGVNTIGLASFAGSCAVLGHCFSPWLGWKGGKGVATSVGVILALSWPALIVFVIAWIAGALVVSRYSSVGSMFASVVAPFALFLFTREFAAAAYGVFSALLILWTHRENIARLRLGTEGPLNLFKRA
jgi:acyl phosphate:glycerol-3-phosphate acyltransferase